MRVLIDVSAFISRTDTASQVEDNERTWFLLINVSTEELINCRLLVYREWNIYKIHNIANYETSTRLARATRGLALAPAAL